MSVNIAGAPFQNPVPDNNLLLLGTDGDIALVLNSAGLAADTALASVLLGTTAGSRQAIAANSLIQSNITANGDWGVYVNNGGVSLEAILVDASTKNIHLGYGGFNLVLSGGTTAPTLNAHAADTVSIAAVDIGAGDRRLAIQTEMVYGGPIFMGAGTIWLRRFYDGTTSAPWYEVSRAGGTYASPTALGAGVNIGELTFSVYDGVQGKDASWPVAAEIRAVSLEAASGTRSSASLNFMTTATGSWNTQLIRQIISDNTVTFQANPSGSELVQFDSYGASAGAFRLRQAIGTLAAPTALQSGQALPQIRWDGYGTAFAVAAAIQPTTTEIWSATAHGAKMVFYVVNNTTVAAYNSVTIDQDGNLLLLGPATTPVLGAATADTVRLAAVDIAAGDRRLAIQSELGSPIYIGNNILNFVAAATISTGATTLTLSPATNIVITEAKNIVLGTTTGTQIGTAANQKLGLWGAAPVIQAAITAAAPAGGTGAAAGAWDTAANRDIAITTINAMRTALINAGIMAAA